MPVLHLEQVELDQLRTIKRIIAHHENRDITDAEVIKRVIDHYNATSTMPRRRRSSGSRMPIAPPSHDDGDSQAVYLDVPEKGEE